MLRPLVLARRPSRHAHASAHLCRLRAQTCNFDTLYAYLSTSNYDFGYDRAKNLRPKRNIKTAMNNGARICKL